MIRLQIQSDAQESALDLIRSAIAAETSRLEFGLKATERHLKTFEERYQVTSEEFLRDFSAEDLADRDLEYVCWAGELRIHERISAQLEYHTYMFGIREKRHQYQLKTGKYWPVVSHRNS